MNEAFLESELRRFLLEDLGHAAVDTRPAEPIRAKVINEQACRSCGAGMLVRMLRMLAASPDQVQAEIVREDGELFAAGETMVQLSVHPEILRHGIRTGLNLLQVLSGIATNTDKLARQVASTGCKLLDTRKTTPGFRAFEKYAVRVGGGKNHRFNRLDGILIKKEDIAIDGGIASAVCRATDEAAHLTGIEVEVETLRQLDDALHCPAVTHILLDNMDVPTVAQAVRTNGGKKILEASGIPTAKLRAYAETGVPFISTSALIREARPIKMRMITY